MPGVKHSRAKEHNLILVSDTTLIRMAAAVLGVNNSVGRDRKRRESGGLTSPGCAWEGLERDTVISKFYSVIWIGLGESCVCGCVYIHVCMRIARATLLT